jgi:hypothetical protein
MNPALEALNRAATDLGSHEETSQIYKDLLYCCHAKKWVEQILRKAPFRSVAELLETSDEIEKSLNDEDWLQAFAGHPRVNYKN